VVALEWALSALVDSMGTSSSTLEGEPLIGAAGAHAETSVGSPSRRSVPMAP